MEAAHDTYSDEPITNIGMAMMGNMAEVVEANGSCD
jgi:hypothetical protein